APKKDKAPPPSSKPAKSGGGKQKKKNELIDVFILLCFKASFFFESMGRIDILGFWMQKWSKGKQKEKVNNAVLFDQANYDKMLSEVPKYKQITPSVLSERLRV
ncbi:hypothetical protein BHE74_00027909, partial [Ensete ventricosum]